MLQLNFSLCQRGVCPAVDPPSQLCPCLSQLNQHYASPKGQVCGVKFNLKPDRVRGSSQGLRSLLCSILLSNSLHVCIYLFICHLLQAMLCADVCLSYVNQVVLQ